MIRRPKKARPLWGRHHPRRKPNYARDMANGAWGHPTRLSFDTETLIDGQHRMAAVTVQFHGGQYTTTRDAFEATCRAKAEGAAAKARGVDFDDNPYRHGPVAPTDWLYSAWEYGYIHGDGPESLGEIVEG